jgi:uncharacterized protein YjbI with pentapeptide repeats
VAAVELVHVSRRLSRCPVGNRPKLSSFIDLVIGHNAKNFATVYLVGQPRCGGQGASSSIAAVETGYSRVGAIGTSARCFPASFFWYDPEMNSPLKVRRPIISVQPESLTVDHIEDSVRIGPGRLDGGFFARSQAKSISIDGAVLAAVEISSSSLRNASIDDCVFNRCLMFGTSFDGSGIHRATFVGGMYSGVVFSDCTIKDVIFESAKLNLSNFRSSRLSSVIFRDCDLTEADFQGAEFRHVEFSRCDLTGAEFSHCKMVGVDLRTSEISGVRGVTGLRGALIDTAQLIGLSHTLASELGVEVSDD